MNKERTIEQHLNMINKNKCNATNEHERIKWEAYERGALWVLSALGHDYDYNCVFGEFVVTLKGIQELHRYEVAVEGSNKTTVVETLSRLNVGDYTPSNEGDSCIVIKQID